MFFSFVKTDCTNMYRAQYDFECTEDQALSFSANDTFTVMDTSDPYWWLVQNGYGQVGYVPENYLVKDDVSYYIYHK